MVTFATRLSGRADCDRRIGAAGARWLQSIPAAATGTAGDSIVSGLAEDGDVEAVVEVVDSYLALECESIVAGNRAGQVAVDPGVTCLDGAT